MSNHKSGGRLPPVSPARRHFMGIAAASAGRLSIIAASAAAVFKAKNANALGIFPRDPDHHCFGRGTLIQTPGGETQVEDLSNGDLVVTTNGELRVKWVGRKTIKRGCFGSLASERGADPGITLSSQLMIEHRTAICIYRRSTPF